MAKKKRKKNPKYKGVAAFGLRHELEKKEPYPVYQRRIENSDLLWLAEEYKKQRTLNPKLTVEEFALQHGIEVKLLRKFITESHEPKESKGNSVTVWHGTTRDRARSILNEGFRTGSYIFRTTSQEIWWITY